MPILTAGIFALENYTPNQATAYTAQGRDLKFGTQTFLESLCTIETIKIDIDVQLQQLKYYFQLRQLKIQVK